MTVFHINFFVSIIIGMIVAGIVSFIFGLVLSKFKGDIYALATFGLNTIIFSIFLNWQEVTRGPLGIPGINRPEIVFGSFDFIFKENLYFLILVALVSLIIFLISEYIVKSSFGR